MNVFLWNARARNGHVEATLNLPFPAQAPFLPASDLDAALGGEAPTAFDWAAVRADADARAAGASFWAGAVDVASLLRPARSSSPAAGDEL